ncbi:MAG: adenylosuccinate lyase, partial [Clostridiales bacterium]|nr:adenylosuccinate lyase [Clostridiales bacterium]
MSEKLYYENPLNTRYASKEMQENFGDEKRFRLWRELWVALAESEMELGLPITKAQVEEMKAHIADIDYAKAEEFERAVRHDVMAHVKTFALAAPSAGPIIHLGATSCFVDCNSEVMIMKDGLDIILKKLVNVMEKLKKFALTYKDVPTLGFTHLQPAQLTTVGKRATLWHQDLMLDYENLMNLYDHIRLRGVKGTTGTQASFLELFDGDTKKVKELEKRVVKKLGYEKVYGVTGQTYPRKFDY